MKNTHGEGDIYMHQMVLAALENQKRISATINVTDTLLLLCFQYWTYRLSIVVIKLSPVKERSALIDVENTSSYLPDLI